MLKLKISRNRHKSNIRGHTCPKLLFRTRYYAHGSMLVKYKLQGMNESGSINNFFLDEKRKSWLDPTLYFYNFGLGSGQTDKGMNLLVLKQSRNMNRPNFPDHCLNYAAKC